MKKLFILVFAIALCLGALCVGASADIQPTKPTVGDGTAANPYQISTAAELAWFAAQVNDDGKTDIDAVLTADITINEGVLDADGNLITGKTFTQWTPIGTVQKQYTGAFDGQGHTISGLYYSGSGNNDAGLFGRIDGGQAEYVRVPFADTGLSKIPDGVSDEQALFAGDILATGYWAAKIADISQNDTVLIIGAGPTGICTLLCARLKNPSRIIVCEKDKDRAAFVKKHYPDVLLAAPENAEDFVKANSAHGGADVVFEVAGTEETFGLAWKCARPNAAVVIVALYDRPQVLPLPDMYGKNLTFKTGGVDGCDCGEILRLIAEGKIDTVPLITHTYPLKEIEKAYDLFEKKLDGVMKIAVRI